MRKRFLERVEGLRGQTGFTLVELMVALVVLSMLVAIAGNYYYHQRRKGWVAQVHASLRHMAGAENNFLYGFGVASYTEDLDDLYASGFRWGEDSVIPYVALATNETFCIQVHSAHDPTIVWHFSSEVGRPQEGPATPSDCGDPEVLGRYISGPPYEDYGRDGQLSMDGRDTSVASTGSDASDLGRSGDDSSHNVATGGTGDPGSITAGFGDEADEMPGTGSAAGSGTTTTSGTSSETGTTGTTGTTTSTTCGGGTGGGSSGGSNHPSGKDRDTENGGSGSQGDAGSDPDGDENGGADKPGQGGGASTGDQDGNNGSGNDTDFEDDNRGPDQDGSGMPGTGCN